MFKTTTSALAITALLTLGAYAQSTDGDATMEQAGDTMEQAGEAAGNAVEQAGEAMEKTGEAAMEAGEAAAENVEATAEETGAAVENAAENAGEALDNAADATAEAASDAGEAVENAAENAETAVEGAAAEGEAAMEEAGDRLTDGSMQPENDAEVTTETVPVTTPAEGEATEAAEAEEPAEGTPVQGQIFEQSPDSFLASTLLGANVQSPDGDNVGEVEDMILKGDGSIEGVVVGVGGFLGIGEKDVALEFGSIEIRQDAETGELTFVTNATEEQLEAAPEFKDSDEMRAEQAAEDAQNAADTQLAPADPNAPATNN